MTKRLSAEARRRQILLSAIHVFAEDTYHGATTKRIADEAGITEALIYRYFGSKRSLFIEAIVMTSKSLVKGLESALTSHRDQPVIAVYEGFRFYTDYMEKYKDLARMIFLVASEMAEDDVREAYIPYQERCLKVIADSLEFWSSKGWLHDFVDDRTGSWLYYGTYMILALAKQSYGKTMDPNFAMSMARPYFKPDIWDKFAEEAADHLAGAESSEAAENSEAED